jgi:hypothetical protein
MADAECFRCEPGQNFRGLLMIVHEHLADVLTASVGSPVA